MTHQKLTSRDRWNTSLYESKHEFVWHYGSELIELLAPQPDERILDLGCGTGQLTQQIAASGAIAIGIDNSPSAIARAKENYPHLQFLVAEGTNFSVEEPFDAVFSNAALHWMKNAQGVIRCIWQALNPGGRFVAEFGGKGNVRQIVAALETVFGERDRGAARALATACNPWYFPSIGEYATLLEQQGFQVTNAVLFERPTRLEDGERGMRNWLEMFGQSWLLTIPERERETVIQHIQEQLQPKLYREEAWWVDYRRLRIIAYKP
ncbi:MAG: class I SAM-dependent methyltransferase [Cyanobacteriota bacterium]|nr:class I SAM-dependent methyltransferase [Cyanobacteriota bacterium]